MIMPGWFLLALLLATVAMFPSMRRRWVMLRNEKPDPAPPGYALLTVITVLWLPAAALMVPAVYVARMLMP